MSIMLQTLSKRLSALACHGTRRRDSLRMSPNSASFVLNTLPDLFRVLNAAFCMQIGNSPTMISKSQFAALLPRWDATARAIHANADADRDLGWAQEMFAFALALANTDLAAVSSTESAGATTVLSGSSSSQKVHLGADDKSPLALAQQGQRLGSAGSVLDVDRQTVLGRRSNTGGGHTIRLQTAESNTVRQVPQVDYHLEWMVQPPFGQDLRVDPCDVRSLTQLHSWLLCVCRPAKHSCSNV